MDWDAGHVTLLFLAAIYFLPLDCAIWRGHPRGYEIIALNVAFGWTVIGWIAALIWAFRDGRRRNGPQAG
jgi:hypothetical protein